MRKIAIRALLAPSLLGAFAGAAASAGCGVDVNPSDCNATNSCGNGDASPDGESDVMLGDGGEAAPPTEGGPEGGPTDGSGDAPHDSPVQCDGSATLVCGGTCYPINDPQHCGSCSNACAGPASGHGSPTCASPPACSVSCSSGYHMCGTPADCLANSDVPSGSGDPCIINEQFGIFVSPMGNDLAAGSQLAPVKTIGKAMDLAKAKGKRVYACGNNGTYNENLVVGSGRDGVNVYGGLDCTTTPAQWKYVAADLASVAPTAAGYALELQGLTTGVTFEDFAFVAADTSAAGASSIPVFVTGAQNVAFHRVSMTAGNVTATGATGASGGANGDPSNHYAGSLNGNTTSTGTHANGNPCTCPDGTSIFGGNGGDATTSPGAGLPAYGGGTAGQNGIACAAGGTAFDGNNAPAGTGDTPSTSLGALLASGWTPATGATNSSNGKQGQGGGGGGDGTNGTGGGGGGACGGCGGVGGKPGGGGGSSIALLSYQSSVSLTACSLTAKNAGAGGTGGGGEQGQAGGFSGNGALGGCQGGNGGAGAGGNGAQGGAGGLSLGIGYSGTAPSYDATTSITFGQKGSGGAGGSFGPAAGAAIGQPGAPGAVGAVGVAQNIMSL